MKIGNIEKGVPIPEASSRFTRKYNIDFDKMEAGDSFVIHVDAGKKIKNGLAYIASLARKNGAIIRKRVIDSNRARIWFVGMRENRKKGGDEIAGSGVIEYEKKGE